MAFAHDGLEQLAIQGGMRSAILYRALYEDSRTECQFFFVNINLVRAWVLRSRAWGATLYGAVTVTVACLRPYWLVA